ncbi:MAG: DUF4062 domain-containing protein [Methylococcaceae bacterium]|nr:DUF4062 domain-containing protein [Methylococcaceae bacterium]
MQWNLFLSSTVRDLEAYRRAVQEACRRKADTACQLSEDGWTGGYADTVSKCRQRVAEADGFILLAGYWYGSVPPGCDRSVTHLEFDSALGKWGQQKFPPMAVMMPEEGSRAQRALQLTATRVMKREQQGNPQFDPQEHDGRLAQFHGILTGTWRTVTRFKDGPDLREWAISNCLSWQKAGRSFLDAAQGLPDAAEEQQVSDEELGRLGRQLQIQLLSELLSEVAAFPAVPALACVVHGGDLAGQRAFLQALPGQCLAGFGARQGPARLPLGGGDPSLLPAWVAKTLGLPGGGVQSVEQLAERLALALRERPRYFLLDRIGELAGGAAAFREQLWLPLYQALSQLRQDQPFAHRLLAVVATTARNRRPGTPPARNPSRRMGPRTIPGCCGCRAWETSTAGGCWPGFRPWRFRISLPAAVPPWRTGP